MAKTQYAHINAQGEIVLPPHLAGELGISPGDEIRIEPNGHGMYVHQLGDDSIAQLGDAITGAVCHNVAGGRSH